MRNKLGDNIRLKHIIDAIKDIESYISDTDFVGFTENSMMRFACIKGISKNSAFSLSTSREGWGE